MSKGTIIFVKCNKLDQVYSRFSLHRQAITHIKEMYDCGHFVSMCEELSLNVSKLSELFQKDLGFQR